MIQVLMWDPHCSLTVDLEGGTIELRESQALFLNNPHMVEQMQSR